MPQQLIHGFLWWSFHSAQPLELPPVKVLRLCLFWLFLEEQKLIAFTVIHLFGFSHQDAESIDTTNKTAKPPHPKRFVQCDNR